MAEKRSARGGDAGAVNAGKHFTRHISDKPDERQPPPGADECCWRLGRALRMGRISRDDWGFDFTRSILRHSKRRGWIPSPKQLYAMRNLVAELAEPDAGPLIDDGGDDAAA